MKIEMKTYTITETCTYHIEAESDDDAVEKFLNLGSVGRDNCFVQCLERDVEEGENWE